MFTLKKISQALRKIKSETDVSAYILVIKSRKILTNETHPSVRYTGSIRDSVTSNGKGQRSQKLRSDETGAYPSYLLTNLPGLTAGLHSQNLYRNAI